MLDKYIEILGFCVGLLYLWWEYHANSRLWLASMVMPAISMWLYFSKGLYADFAINIYYFAIAIYGYWAWTRRSSAAKQPKKQKNLKISHIPPSILMGASAAFAAIWLAIYLILRHLTDSQVPVCDSFTTALSIVAMWLLARKYIEQWYAWMIADAVCVGLYIYKGIFFYAGLYAIYTIVAFFGYRKWLKLMLQNGASTSNT